MLIRVLDAGHRPQLAHGAGLDARPALEREMHGAAACNVDEPGLLLIAQLAFQRDVADEGIRWRRIGRASVPDADARAGERPAWSASSSDTKLFGCRAAWKIAAALSMLTVLSPGACSTSSARRG